VDALGSNSNSSDKKKLVAEVCKDKNVELSRSDPIRPFISGHVANSMAAEVIDLLHCLLSAPETLAAQTWASAVESVLSSALSSLPILLSSLEALGDASHNQLITMAKQANAALAALGGFDETVKAGCEVEIQGEGIHNSGAQVVTVSEQAGMVTAKLQPPSDDDFQPPRYSETVQVPISRLRPPRNQVCSVRANTFLS
jgi:E3 ubiquitin-protein ligase HECTD4